MTGCAVDTFQLQTDNGSEPGWSVNLWRSKAFVDVPNNPPGFVTLTSRSPGAAVAEAAGIVAVTEIDVGLTEGDGVVTPLIWTVAPV
jgi:hypothetical protein